MAYIQLGTVLAIAALLDKCHPTIPQLPTFVENKGHQGPHVLYREGGGRDPALALVHGALRSEHAAPYERGDEAAGLPGLFVGSAVLQDMPKGNGVESEQPVIPLRRAA